MFLDQVLDSLGSQEDSQFSQSQSTRTVMVRGVVWWCGVVLLVWTLQTQAELHVFRDRPGNEGLCLEILGMSMYSSVCA